MTDDELIKIIAGELLDTDALTGDNDGTPTMYSVHPDDVEYLVKTILDIWAEMHA